MKTIFVSIAVFIVMAMTSSVSAWVAPAETKSAVDTKLAMRKLWEDHITYTRNYIISALAGIPDADAVAARLMKNQDEIGDAIKPYYGDAAGNKLATLLKEHITVASEVVKAAKASNSVTLAAAQKRWEANADDIAKFLAGANPNWKESEIQAMLHKHLDLTTGEVTARLMKDWAADQKSYDDGHAHMLIFSDILTDGIAKQFPDRFTK